MAIWKEAPVDSNMNWILVDENNSTEIIASITVSKNSGDTCDIEAICKKIGYTCRFERLERWRLKTIVRDLKRTVKYEINRLIEENQKPTPKKIYKMIDGIPVWRRLKDGAEETKIHLIANDYGKLTEIMGKRILKDVLQRGGILDSMFPGIEIVKIHQAKEFKVLERARIGLGDLVLEVNYKKDDKFGKKIVVFEIKHGKIIIDQNQLRRYCSMVLNPGEYLKKADELKVIYMMFDNIDTLNATASYSIQEIDKDFARTVVERVPIEIDYDINKIDNNEDGNNKICRMNYEKMTMESQ